MGSMCGPRKPGPVTGRGLDFLLTADCFCVVFFVFLKHANDFEASWIHSIHKRWTDHQQLQKTRALFTFVKDSFSVDAEAPGSILSLLSLLCTSQPVDARCCFHL